MERNPVVLSLLLLRDLGVQEEHSPLIQDQWASLWNALVAFRDSIPAENWNDKIYKKLVNPEFKGVKTPASPEWKALSIILDTIYTRINP